MWDLVLIILVIFIVRYFFGSGSAGVSNDTRSIMEILGGHSLIKRDNSSKNFDELQSSNDIILLYFSAHWCPPCRGFTPMLADVYNQLKRAGKNVEVIFVSSDRSSQSMIDYMVESHGDWFCVPFDDPARQQLGGRFNVRGIPTLVVLRKDGSVVTTEGRGDVQSMQAACFDKWMK